MMTKFDTRLTLLSQEVYARILPAIAAIDERKGQWTAGVNLHPQTLGNLKRSVLITSTGASTRIEGARLSDGDIEKLMRGIAIQTFHDRDVAEVKGYYELLGNVFDSWKTIHLSEGVIKSFHKQLLQYVKKDETHRGEYKQKENKVMMVNASGQSVGVLFNTTPAYLTPAAMHDLIAWTADAMKQKTYHPLLIIGSCIVEFLAIHPFEDGNGRLSRILTNLLLLHAGYAYIPYVSHEKLIEDNKPEYYMALRKSQNTFGSGQEHLEPWFTFFLSVMTAQSNLAVSLLRGEQIETLLSKQQQVIWQYMQEHHEVRTGVIIKDTGIPRATVKQALVKLQHLGRIAMLGRGRGARWEKKIPRHFKA
ncbi:Fic family protein [Patescibacteria group bacterium]|nr:Fic family protein [Patescibacteria group bacterium]